MVKETKRVLNDEAARKELDIKQPGWLPDTIATKGLFDVFLKNKVIEWCDVWFWKNINRYVLLLSNILAYIL